MRHIQPPKLHKMADWLNDMNCNGHANKFGSQNEGWLHLRPMLVGVDAWP